MSSMLKGAAPGRALQWSCGHCQGRVLLVAASRDTGRKQIMLHLIKAHDKDGLILEGADFLEEPAPYRCDLCLAVSEPPWWTYVTPPTATYEVEDPGWLVCAECHDIISQDVRPLAALVDRSAVTQRRQLIVDSLSEPELRDHIKESIKAFLDHLQGEPSYGGVS